MEIVTLQSGTPFSIYSSGDQTAGAAQGSRTDAFADLAGDLSTTGDRKGQQTARFFNSGAVVQAAAGTYGSLGRNILRGRYYNNTDLNVSRAFWRITATAGDPRILQMSLKAEFQT